MTSAVFFDVDFTLIYPGPTFRGSGYREFGERNGLDLEPACEVVQGGVHAGRIARGAADRQ